MVGEGGDLGMRVRITPIIDQGKLNAESKKVETQLNKTMPKGSGGILGRIGGFANRMGAGSGVGNAAVAGAVGGIIASAMNGVMGLLKKVFSVMVESSGSLRNVLKLLNMGFLQIIRPFADVLAIMLRPIAMFFRIIGREVMKRVREKRKELKAQGYSGIALGGALMAELPSIYLDVLMEQLSKIDWGTFFSKILNVLWENLTVRLPAFLGKVFEILNGLGNWIWENIILAIGNLAVTELANFGWWIWNEIVKALGTAASWVASMFEGMGDFASWIWTEIVKALGTAVTWVANMFEGAASFGAWLWNQIIGAFGTAASWVSQMFEGMGDFASWIWNEVKKIFGVSQSKGAISQIASSSSDPTTKFFAGLASGGVDVLNILSGGLFSKVTGMASGGMMTGDGLIYAHAGEVVKDRGDIEAMIRAAASSGGGGNVTVVIPGSAMVDAIDRRVDHYYRTKVANRR